MQENNLYFFYGWLVQTCIVANLLLLRARLLLLQGSLFLVYRGETSLEKTPYFQ